MELDDARQATCELNDTGVVARGWYGFEQPAGWSKIVLELHERILTFHPDYQVHQVKEKFGGLRYYCSVDSDPQIAEWIRQAERDAAVTCQVTGRPGATRQVNARGWLATLCDEMAAPFAEGVALHELEEQHRAEAS